MSEADRLLRLFDQTPGFLAVLRGPDHVFELANAAYAGLVGHRDVTGKPVAEALPEVVGQGLLDVLNRVFTTGTPFVGRAVRIGLQQAPGAPLEEVVLDFIYQPITEPDGRVSGILVQGHDVTEQHRAEAALREREARYRTLFTSIDEGYCLCEMVLGEDGRAVDYRFLEINPLFSAMTGLPEASVGRTAYDLVPDLEPYWVETYARAALGGESFRFEQGSAAMGRWFDVYVAPAGTPGDGRFVLVFNDVTARRRAEDALRQSEERARLALDAADLGVWMFDHDAGTFTLDARAQQAYGLGPDPVPMADFVGRVHPDDRERLGRTIGEALSPRGHERYAVGYRVVHPDGAVRHLDVRVGVRFEGAGAERRAVASFGTVADVTERRARDEALAARTLEVGLLNESLEQRVEERTEALAERTEALRRSNAALADSNRELQDFAQVASHDLQEPLRKIQMFAGLLVEEHGPTLAPEALAYADRMRAAADRMGRLITDLLTYSRITTRGRGAEVTSLDAALDGALGDLEARLDETGGRVERAGPLGVVRADPVQLHQLLLNLVGNGLKFHKPGEAPVVRVSARAEKGGVVVTVEDNGVGFDPKYAERIFGPFQRLHGRGTYDGTGIGLAVVRRVMERHGGTVTAEGRPGEGATFTATFPAP